MLGSRVRPLDPVSAAWNTVARFDDYEIAQRAVDQLSDDGFPVEQLDIVGSGLQLVERVTGRLTRGRGRGRAERAVGGPAVRHTDRAVHVRALLPCGRRDRRRARRRVGGRLRVLAHASTKGRRDFSSVRQLVATQYDLIARGGTVDRARSMLNDAGLLPSTAAAR